MNDYTGIGQTSQKLSHSDGSPMRALVVDDEESLADLVGMSLRYEGWDVKTAHSVAEAMSCSKTFVPDIAVLDIMLPDGDGLSLMKSLRAVHAGLPVLFLTAKDAVDDRVAGLTAGGDDYVTKPFSLEELVARSTSMVPTPTRLLVMRSLASLVAMFRTSTSTRPSASLTEVVAQESDRWLQGHT